MEVTQTVEAAVPPVVSAKKNIFADLSALKLSTAAFDGAKEYLSKLPARKAGKQEFWRAHADEGMSLVTHAFEDKGTNEYYIIAPNMLPHMLALDAVVAVKFTPAITRQGTLLLVPAKLPGEASSNTSWQDTMLLAVERAKKKWVRVSADMALGGYRIFEAVGELSEPVWPDMTLNEMLEISFRDRVIDSEDHPIFNKLLGRI